MRPEEITKGVRLDGKENAEPIRYLNIHRSVKEARGMACVLGVPCKQSEDRVLKKR